MEKGNETKTVVPALRFPEFRGMGGWRKSHVYEECPNSYSGGTPKTTEKIFYGGNIPFIRSAEIGKNKTELYITQEGLNNSSAKMIQKGDLLIALYGANSGDIAIAKIDGAINQAILCLRAKENNLFIYYTLQKNKKNIVSKYLQGGQGNLSAEIIKSIVFYMPQKTEQQKIADCLSSLDDLIEATNRKIEALKEHKKGLMQRLFPKEGKNVPELRFPEYQGMKGWDKCILGDSLLEHPRYGINAPAVPFQKELATYIRITDISENGTFLPNPKVSVDNDNVDNFYLSMGDLVFARTGASVGKCYKYREKDGKLVFAGFLIKITPNSTKLSSDFLFQYTFSKQYWEWVHLTSTRSGQPGINSKEFFSMPFCLPTVQEQQKIADCLSSLDELIEVTSQKVEILKKHKKGLMQQLFPKI